MLIKFKNISLWLFLALILLTIGLFFTYSQIDRQTVIQSIKKEELQTIKLSKRTLKEEMEQGISDILYISHLSNLSGFLRGTDNKTDRSEVNSDFKLFLSTHSAYAQLKILDLNGDEKIRIVKTANDTVVTATAHLENMTHESYFTEGIALSNKEVFVTKFQPRKLNGRIEIPINPELNFVSPIYHENDNQLIGLAVLKLEGRRLIDAQRALEGNGKRQLLITNSEGYFMKGLTPDEEWGFMYEDKKNNTLENILPDVWGLFKNKEIQPVIGGKIYSYLLICDGYSECPENKTASGGDVLNIKLKGQDFPWLLISVTDINTTALVERLDEKKWLFYVFILLLLAIIGIGVYATRKYNMASNLYQVAEQHASHADNFLQSFIEHTPAHVFCKDLSGHYEFANTAYLDSIDKDVKTLIGMTNFELSDQADNSHIIIREQEVIHHQRVVISVEVWKEKGVDRNYAVTRFPIKNSNNTLVSVGTIALDITEREKDKAKNEESMALFKAVVEYAPDGIILVNEEGLIIFANQQANDIFGWSTAELVTMTVEDLMPQSQHDSHQPLRQNYFHNPLNVKPMEGRIIEAVRKNGTDFNLEISISPISTKFFDRFVCVCRDVTKRIKVESHLKHTQKLEAVGQLTGGIAHDFNNMLGIVMGNLDLLKMTISDEKSTSRIDSAMRAAMNGAGLTKRLLAFAHKQALQSELFAMEALLDELTVLLERTLTTDINLNIILNRPLANIIIDRSEFENVMLNMAINARDAMPSGGMLTIEASNVVIDKDDVVLNNEVIKPGLYIHIIISDTGIGIPKNILPNIFEPFFSTKEAGKGTGLGLAMVYGFIKQIKGMIKVYSEQDIGTTFHVYLPAIDNGNTVKITNRPKVKPVALPYGTERILVVDDERDLAEIASAYLDDLGYQTKIAFSAEEALEILKNDSSFSLIFTDIVMPDGLSGIAFHDRVSSLYPKIAFLYASGFSEMALQAKNGNALKAKLINKPYDRNTLALEVRNILDNQNKTYGNKL